MGPLTVDEVRRKVREAERVIQKELGDLFRLTDWSKFEVTIVTEETAPGFGARKKVEFVRVEINASL